MNSLEPLSVSPNSPLNETGQSGEEHKEAFASLSKTDTFTDGRKPGEWQTKYPTPAVKQIRLEAFSLLAMLVVLTIVTGFLLGLSGENVSFVLPISTDNNGTSVPLHFTVSMTLLITYCVGALGGTMFSTKWLIHAVAKCKWHLDRRYWRMLVPFMGGVYACVLLALLDNGAIGLQSSTTGRTIGMTAAYAFLVGYFSDGVSGLLSNLANAVFGTIDKK